MGLKLGFGMDNPHISISPTQVRVWFGDLAFWLANTHIQILPTQVRVWDGELEIGNLGLRWPTHIYRFHQPKFEFGVTYLGSKTLVWVGVPSDTIFANPNS